jgi:hypothetical protein
VIYLKGILGILVVIYHNGIWGIIVLIHYKGIFGADEPVQEFPKFPCDKSVI